MYDTIVIGGGIIGSSAAYQCAKNAYHSAQGAKKILLLEQFALDHKNGSSHGKSRIIRLCHTDPLYVKMAQESYTLWDEMKALDNNNAIYTSCGLLWLGDRKETLERAGYLEKCNADYEILSGKEIRKKFPYLNYDSEEEDWHAVLDKKGGVIHAERALQSAQRLFKKFGGEIKEHAKVIEVIPGSVVKIKLLDGTVYETKQLIVTVGAWLTALMPEIKVASVPKLVSVNFWKLKDEYKDKEHYFEPDNMSPCLIITKGEEELFMIPGN